MKPVHRNKALLGLGLVLVIAWAGAAHGQVNKTFTGKIKEMARATQLDIGMGKKDTFYILRIEDYPKIEFRLASEDAVRFGVIEAAGPSEVLTPKKSKGLGWRVKLICDGKNLGLVTAPIYKVISLERLND